MKNLIFIAVVLLVSISFGLHAQEDAGKQDKEIRVKMVKETDEGRTVIDTTIMVGDIIGEEEMEDIKVLLDEYGLGDIDVTIGDLDEMLEDIDIEIKDLKGDKDGAQEIIILKKAGASTGDGEKRVNVTVITDDSTGLEKTVKVVVDGESYEYVVTDKDIEDAGVIMFKDDDGKKTRVMVGGEDVEWIDEDGAIKMTVEVDDEGEVYVITTGDETIELKDVKGKHMMIMKEDGSSAGEKEVFLEVIQTNDGGKEVHIQSKIIVTALSDTDMETLEKAGVKVDPAENETLELDRLSFHPNPTDGKFTVAFEADGSKESTLQVFDIGGKEIFSKKLKSQDGRYEQDVDLTAEKSGTYFLRISQGNKAVTKKIIVE